MPPTSLFTLTAAAATRVASVAAASTLVAAASNSQRTKEKTYAEETNHESSSFTFPNNRKSSRISNRFNTNRRITLQSSSNLAEHYNQALKSNPATSCEGNPNNGSVILDYSYPNPVDIEHQSTLYEEEPIRFQKSLDHHRKIIDQYKQKWDYVENRASRVPTTQWPAYPKTLPFPHTTELTTLLPELKYCQTSPNYQNDKQSYCQPLQFQIAYILLSQQQELPHLEEKEHSAEESVRYGWNLLKELAELGHADAMCLYAQTLNNGNILIPLEADPQSAVAWWHHCHSLHPTHAQTIYELGVACYTGEGTSEDEVLAVQYFHKAALLNHAGAAYMLGDCLLDGVGCKNGKRDRALALEWLIQSGDLGHRGARSRVLAVLEFVEGGDYGGFTDASRQTLKEESTIQSGADYKPVVARRPTDRPKQFSYSSMISEEEDMEPDLETEEDEERRHWSQVRQNVLLNERKYTVGGVSSVSVLRKRRTVVLASRDSNIPADAKVSSGESKVSK